MNGKITLITPPDFFENSNLSLLFFNLTNDEQQDISEWFSKNNLDKDVNLYLYTGEQNIEWLLYAINRCDYKYINLEHLDFISSCLYSYILSKSKVYYKCVDKDVSYVLKYINQNNVLNIEEFLKEIFVVVQS
jgi:hypothetical protein